MDKKKTSKEIFQQACDAIGKHYEQKGFKYTKSRPKITIKNKKIKLEINFWSSRYNDSDSFVNLEILPNFYSLEHKNNRKGFMFGHSLLFYKSNPNQFSKNTIINQIYGDVTIRDSFNNKPQIIDNCNCNVYEMNQENFSKIISFIDTKIIFWFDKIQTSKGVLNLVKNIDKEEITSLLRNKNFLEYCMINDFETNLE